MTTFRSPGWYGLRTRRFYWIVRDVKRHPLRFFERHRYGTRCLVRLGRWQVWVRGPMNQAIYP